ncbi:MAG TPA: hypothetical protein VLA16_04345 [Ideonella sp.]|nr:hypothetical protein [Ideonella sp.]
MSIRLTHRLDGLYIVEAGKDEMRFDVRPRISSAAPPPARPNPGGLDPEQQKPIKIVLGPRPRPPRPMSVVVAPNVGGRSRDGSLVPVLDLGQVVASGQFDRATMEMLRESASHLAPDKPLRVDAYLPPGHSVDVSALTDHVGHLSDEISHPIKMRLGTHIVDE